MSHRKSSPVRSLLLASFLMFCALSECLGANHFVRSAATGANNGSDWTNAYTDLPTSLIRGDVYYVAGGTYKPHLFKDPDSGAAIIEIRAATAADHGTDTGFAGSYVAQATFSSGAVTSGHAIVEFDTDYYVINGQYRGTDWQSGYGIHISDASKSADEAAVLIGTRNPSFAHDITLSFVDVEGSHSQTDAFNEQGIEAINGSYNLIFQSSYIHDQGNTNFFLRGPGSATGVGTGNNITIQNNWIARNYSSSAVHGEGCACSEGLTNFTIRNNIFEDIEGTGFIATPSGAGYATGNSGNGPWDIYGNVMFFKTARPGCGVGAIFQVFDVAFKGDLNIYNNTFANINSKICPTNGSGGIFVGLGMHAIMKTIRVRDNIWYNSDYFTSGVSCTGLVTCTAVEWNSNAYFSQTVNGTEPNMQTGSGNPFMTTGTDNYHLAAATMGGATLSSAYASDLDGKARGADGLWDRGAFEYDSGKKTPAPPTNVRVVVH